MKKLFLIAYYMCPTIIVSGIWHWHPYRKYIREKISSISSEQMEWIRENCGVKREKRTEKRESIFKISGGKEMVDFQYPWAVGIEIHKRVFRGLGQVPVGYITSLCSGSLISNKHVLTAQHCFTNIWLLPQRNETKLLFGSETHFKSRITIGQANPTPGYRHVTEESSRYVSQTDYHSFPPTSGKHDWALLELKDAVPQNLTDIKAIVPVCLPASNETVESFDEVEAYGQGLFHADPNGSNVSSGIMRHIHTTISSTKVVQQNIFLWENVIGITAQFSRPGDSGGGVTKEMMKDMQILNSQAGSALYKKRCKHVLVGITKGRPFGPTLAVDVRTVTDRVQHLTGIRV